MATPTSTPQFSPEYLNENISGQLLAATTVILAAATLFLALRVYARKLTTATWGWDDYLLFASWIFLIGTSAICYIAVTMGGAGRHVQAVVAENPLTMITRGQNLYAIVFVSTWSNQLSRLSVVALFLRIFTKPWARRASYGVAVYLVAMAFVQTIAALLSCRPMSFFWNRTIPGGTCIDLFAFYKAVGFSNIASDIFIGLLPIHTVWNLQATLARKAGIALVFASGSLGLVASCVRTASFFTSMEVSLTDPTWADVDLMCWTVVESGMYVIAGCLIGLRPLLNKLAGVFGGQTQHKYASYPERSRNFAKISDSVALEETNNDSRVGISVKRDYTVSTSPSSSMDH